MGKKLVIKGADFSANAMQDCVYFDGAHYINTGYAATASTKIEIVFSGLSVLSGNDGAWLYGARTTSSAGIGLLYKEDSNGKYVVPYITSQIYIMKTIDANEKHNIVLYSSAIVIDGVSTSFSESITPNGKSLLIGTNVKDDKLDSAYAVMTLYQFRIYEGDTLVKNLVPKNSSTLVDTLTGATYSLIG